MNSTTPLLDIGRETQVLDTAWLDTVAEYLDGAVFDGDPCTDFDCSRDWDYQEAA